MSQLIGKTAELIDTLRLTSDSNPQLRPAVIQLQKLIEALEGVIKDRDRAIALLNENGIIFNPMPQSDEESATPVVMDMIFVLTYRPGMSEYACWQITNEDIQDSPDDLYSLGYSQAGILTPSELLAHVDQAAKGSRAFVADFTADTALFDDTDDEGRANLITSRKMPITSWDRRLASSR